MPDSDEIDRLKAELSSLRQRDTRDNLRASQINTLDKQQERLDQQHNALHKQYRAESRTLRTAYLAKQEQIANALEAASDLQDKASDLYRETTTDRGLKKSEAMQDEARLTLRRLYKERNHLQRDYEANEELRRNVLDDAIEQIDQRRNEIDAARARLQQRPESPRLGDFRPHNAPIKPTQTAQIWAHHTHTKGQIA